MPNYFIIKEFRAPNSKNAADGSIDYKIFVAGDFIGGKESNYTTRTGKVIPVVKTSDGWNIPLDSLEKYDPAEGSAPESVAELQEAQKKVVGIVKHDYLQDLIDLSATSAKGVALGAALGFGYAMFSKKSFLWCPAIGGFFGGIAGYQLQKFKLNKKLAKAAITNGK